MSGGSWNYAYKHLEPIAERLLSEQDPLRRALGSQLMQIKHALHDMEWADSGDYSQDQAKPALIAALGGHKAATEAVLMATIATGDELLKQMRDLLQRARGAVNGS